MQKYERGERITSIDEFCKAEWIMFCDNVYPRCWFLNWQIGWVLRRISYGIFYTAKRKDGGTGE